VIIGNAPIKEFGEIRGKDQPFVYSRLMCWVALDRGLRLADKRSFPAERQRWLDVRDKIYEEIMEKAGMKIERRCTTLW
jgi:GH15 family glucan-1,4-alpha-glucosidase